MESATHIKTQLTDTTMHMHVNTSFMANLLGRQLQCDQTPNAKSKQR